MAASPVPNDRHSSAHVQKGRPTAGVQYRLVGGQHCERVQSHWCVHEHPRRRRSLYSPHREIANQARGRRTSVGVQLSACWSHRAQEGRCDRAWCRRSRGPVAWSSALKTAEAAAAEAAEAEAEEAEAAAAAEAEAEAAEAAAAAVTEAAAKEAEKAADGSPVRKPERRSVPAAARPSLLAQPLGPVMALRVGESTGSAPSGLVARERRFGWDPEQARRRAGVPTLRKGEGSTRRRRQRSPGGTPRSRAPSASCLPLSRLVRHRVTSPSAAARGLGTLDPISACGTLQSLVRVVCPGCRYLDGGGVHPLLVTRRRSRSSARGEAGFSSEGEADDGTRTHDPWLGKPMLYQLSYVRRLPRL